MDLSTFFYIKNSYILSYINIWHIKRIYVLTLEIMFKQENVWKFLLYYTIYIAQDYSDFPDQK